MVDAILQGVCLYAVAKSKQFNVTYKSIATSPYHEDLCMQLLHAARLHGGNFLAKLMLKSRQSLLA